MNYSAFLAYVFVTTFTPGPNNIVSMTNGVRYGYKNVLGFLAGIFCGFAVVMLICGSANFLLIRLLPQVQSWLNLLGAVYMVYLAVHILQSKPAGDSLVDDRDHHFKAGFGMQFLNLKVILYGVTVFATFIIPNHPSATLVLAFSLLLAAVGFIATSCWALSGDLFRKWLQRYQRVFNFLMAGLLVYTAIASVLH